MTTHLVFENGIGVNVSMHIEREPRSDHKWSSKMDRIIVCSEPMKVFIS